MKPNLAIQAFLGLYILIFFLYLFGPLVIMSVTAFNSAEFPAITPWECFSFRWFNEGKIAYDGQRLAGLVTDRPLHEGIITSLIIAGTLLLGFLLMAVMYLIMKLDNIFLMDQLLSQQWNSFKVWLIKVAL